MAPFWKGVGEKTPHKTTYFGMIYCDVLLYKCHRSVSALGEEDFQLCLQARDWQYDWYDSFLGLWNSWLGAGAEEVCQRKSDVIVFKF